MKEVENAQEIQNNQNNQSENVSQENQNENVIQENQINLNENILEEDLNIGNENILEEDPNNAAPNEAEVQAKHRREREKANKIRSTYKAQATLEDKIAFILKLYTYVDASNKLKKWKDEGLDYLNDLDMTPQWVKDGMTDEEKAFFTNQSQEDRNLLNQQGLELGSSEEVEAVQAELLNDLLVEISGDGSRKAINKGYAAIQLQLQKLYVMLGDEYRKMLNELPEDAQNREAKAMFVGSAVNAEAAGVSQNIGTIQGMEGLNLALFLNPNEENLQTVIWNKSFARVKYQKRTTTMQDITKAMELDADEAALFLADMGCQPADKAYDVYKAKLQAENQEAVDKSNKKISDWTNEINRLNNEIEALKDSENEDDKKTVTEKTNRINSLNNNITQEQFLLERAQEELNKTITDSEVKEYIKKEYCLYLGNLCMRENIRGYDEYLGEFCSENMTVGHFMKIIKMPQYEKLKFFSQERGFGGNETDKILTVFRNKMKEKEPDKEFSTEEVKEAVRAFATRTLKLKAFRDVLEAPGTNLKSMTVEQFFKAILIDGNQFAINKFLKKFNCQKEEHVFDVFQRYMPNHPGREVKEVLDIFKPAGISDEDYAVLKYMENFVFDSIEFAPAEQTSKAVEMDQKFSSSLLAGEKISFEKGKVIHTDGPAYAVPQEPDTENDPQKREYYKWAKTQGLILTSKDKIKNNIQLMKDLEGTLISKAPILFNNDPMIANYNDSINRVAEVNTTFLRGAIKELEATKTGYGYRHEGKNSTEYEKMLKSLKTFWFKMEAKDTEDMVEARNDLKKRLLKYLDGKEAVRKRDFGNVRFKIAMTVLCQLSTPAEFEAKVNQVNHDGKRAGSTLVSVKGYRDEYDRIKGREILDEEKRQEAAEADRLTMPQTERAKIARVEAVFGRNPQYEAGFAAAFGTEEQFKQTFTRLDEENNLMPIGKNEVDRKLSEQDFTAIAFAGTLTVESASLDTRFIPEIEPGKENDPKARTRYYNLAEQKVLLFGFDYTRALMENPVPVGSGAVKHVIQNGRMAALDAMQEYALGNKEPLAHIIASGVNRICAACRTADKITEDFFLYGEMGLRLTGMLERDQELMKLALNNGMMKADVTYVSSIAASAELFRKARDAEIALGDQQTNAHLTENQKLELTTDILTFKVVQENLNSKYDKIAKDDAVETKMMRWRKETDAKIQAIDANGSLSQEQKEAKYENVMSAHRIEVLELNNLYRGYRGKKTLFDSIANPEEKDSLRKAVKEMVTTAQLEKRMPETILKETKSKSYIGKLATLQKNIESQGETEKATERDEQRKLQARRAERQRQRQRQQQQLQRANNRH